MFVMLVIVDCIWRLADGIHYAISVVYYIGGFGEFGELSIAVGCVLLSYRREYAMSIRRRVSLRLQQQQRRSVSQTGVLRPTLCRLHETSLPLQTLP